MCVAQPGFAGVAAGSPLGGTLGFVVGTVMPFGIGGVAAIAVVSLILGIQLLKRKK